MTKSSLPKKLALLLDAYDEGVLPEDLQVEMAQFLIDCDLHNELTQYQQLCDYFIAEGLCYEVAFSEVDDNE
tara:strand:- start:1937 stop:2152 length:216 start_codon:yes stop_codon:yes gene_type:complete